MSRVVNLIEDNMALLYKLDLKGIKNISTALDYIIIFRTFKSYDFLNNKSQQIFETAEKCKVTTRTVSQAISILDQPLT